MRRDFPRRRSIRLPGWDYRLPGPYAVTICTEDRIHRFGDVRDACMAQNVIGEMVQDVLLAMPHEFPTLTLDACVVMPNHVHAIFLQGSDDITRNPVLGTIIQRFKSISTSRYITGVRHHGWEPFPGRLWQRNYYEHIIRDDRDWERCRDYIEANPANWATDLDNVPPGAPARDERPG